MSRARKIHKPRFIWQGTLILMPVVALSVLGAVFVQRDKDSVRREAWMKGNEAAQQLADYIGPKVEAQMEVDYLEAINAREKPLKPETKMQRSSIFNANEFYEVPMAEYRAWMGALPAYRGGLVGQAEGKPLLIIGQGKELLWPTPYPEIPTPSFETQAEATNNDRIGRTQAGLPKEPLAEFANLKFALTHQPETVNAAAKRLAQSAVTWPSILSELFLEAALKAERGEETNAVLRLREEWQADEAARGLYGQLKDQAPNGLLVTVNQTWQPWLNDEEWFTVPTKASRTNGMSRIQADAVHVIPRELIGLALQELKEQAHVRLPDYEFTTFDVWGVEMQKETEGEIVGNAVIPWRRKATKIGPWQIEESAGIQGAEVRIRLRSPNTLFAMQQQRATLFASLIVAALLAAIAGLFTARRAFYRQLQLSELKSNFVASVSHELRAPIAAVRLMAEGLERGTVSSAEKQKDYFQFIVQECRRLSSLIENVLDFSRIEQGRKEYELEPTDLAGLTAATVKLMQVYAEERGIVIEARTTGAPVAVELDGKAVQQALINLLDNAIKHSARDTKITVGLEFNAADATVGLWVEDQGTGIPAAEQAKIFERFYRVGSELRRETQGVGIGLSLVKHIVEAHGGSVSVKSELGAGSRFTLRFPAALRTKE